MDPQFLIFFIFAVVSAEYITPNYQDNSIVSYGGAGAPSSPFATQAYPRSGGNNYVSPVYRPEIYEQHVPIIKDGVPVDTPEVQSARAQHFALYAKAAAAAEAAKARSAQRQHITPDDDGYYQSPKAYYSAATANQYTVPHSSGSSSSYIYQSSGHLSNSGADGHQVGEPVETAEVQHAKAAHFTALLRAAARTTAPDHQRYRRSAFGYSSVHGAQFQHVPVITKDGVPVETPEVQTAKAQHFLAHANAKVGHLQWAQASGGYGSGWTNYGTPKQNNVQYSINHNYGSWKPYAGPLHYPQINKDGVPLETPEVQIAKQQHFLAHSNAKQGLYGHFQTVSYGASYPHVSLTPDGVPEETPEVKIAKARHFAAHAEEQARHVKWSGSGYGESGYSYETNSHHY